MTSVLAGVCVIVCMDLIDRGNFPLQSPPVVYLNACNLDASTGKWSCHPSPNRTLTSIAARRPACPRPRDPRGQARRRDAPGRHVNVSREPLKAAADRKHTAAVILDVLSAVSRRLRLKKEAGCAPASPLSPDIPVTDVMFRH